MAAATVTQNGLVYTLSSNGAYYSVEAESASTPTIKTANISSEIDGIPVTTIGEYAFQSCWSLTDVTIPNSVTTIGYRAFDVCKSLTSIDIPDSVTSIGSGAFANCSALKSITIPNSVTSIRSETFSECFLLTDVTIPDSVTSIGYDAFQYCSALKSITIPNSVTSIEMDTFSYCSELTDVTIGNGVTTIVSGAFSYCESLKRIIIPNSVTSIGYGAFEGCKALTDFTLNSTTAIPEATSVFDECDALTKVKYTRAGVYTNGGTWNGKTLVYSPPEQKVIQDGLVYRLSDDSMYYSVAAENISITTANISPEISGIPVTTIKERAFKDCTALTRITIGNSVTSIGDYAFEDCSSLTSISIPNSVTSIGRYAFGWCTSLTRVTIGNSVTSIGYMAFHNCYELTSINIPDSVTTINDSAFNNCTSLPVDSNGAQYENLTDKNVLIDVPVDVTSFDIPTTVKFIHSGAFRECAKLTSINIPNSVISIGSWAFNSCSALTSITVDENNTVYRSEGNCLIEKATDTLIAGCKTSIIPNGVTSIGDDAFLGCTSLTSIIIPDSVTSIGDSAFYDCWSLTDVTIGNSVTSIKGEAFYWCYSLTSISIPDSVNTIGASAFESCSDLTSVTIGNSVTLIGREVFRSCKALTDFILNSTTAIPETTDVFYGCDALTEVKYTQSGVYTNGGTWNGKKLVYFNPEQPEQEVEQDGLVYILSDDSNYYSVKWDGTTEIVDVVIQDYISGVSVTTIESSAFESCSSLTSIDIPNSVTSIGGGAFGYCSKLTSITIPDGVTSIGNYTFIDCSALTSINIPDGVTSIGYYVFQYCSSLTSINIPDGVTSIGTGVFSGCSALESITIPDSVTSIGYMAFRDCIALTSVTIPDNVTSIGNNAFGSCTNLTDFTLNSTTAIPEATDVFDGCDDLTEVKYTQAIAYNEGETWNGKTLVYVGEGEDDPYEGILIFELSADENYYSVKAASTSITGNIDIPATYKNFPVTTISEKGFYNCKNITGITLNDGLTTIDKLAFAYCSGIISVTIPNSVTSTGISIFSECTSLTNATIGTGLKELKSNIFYGCTSLKTVNINGSSTLIEIATRTFYNCENLETIYFPPTLKTIGEETFKNCSKLKGALLEDGTYGIKFFDQTYPGLETHICNYAFDSCSSITKLILPKTDLYIHKYAFNSCTSLDTEITNDMKLMKLGPYAFYNTRISKVYFPETLTQFGEGDSISDTSQGATFSNCANLRELTFNSKLTKIPQESFKFCNELTSVTIPSTVTTIGDFAFSNCTNLSEFTLNSISPIPSANSVLASTSVKRVGYTVPRVYTEGEMWNEKELVYVGDPYQLEYELNERGTAYTLAYAPYEIVSDDFEIPLEYNGLPVTAIGDNVFVDCTELTSITIPDSIISIGENAFTNCTALTSVVIGRSVMKMTNSFNNCPALTNVRNNSFYYIDDSDGIFVDCDALKNVIFTVSGIGYINGNLWGNKTLVYENTGYIGYEEIGLGLILISDPTHDGDYIVRAISPEIIAGLVTKVEINKVLLDCFTIPKYYKSKPVYKVAEAGFYNCNSIQLLYTYGALIDCCRNSFEGCSSITKVIDYIEDDINYNNLKNKRNKLYQYICNGKYITSDLVTTFVINKTKF